MKRTLVLIALIALVVGVGVAYAATRRAATVHQWLSTSRPAAGIVDACQIQAAWFTFSDTAASAADGKLYRLSDASPDDVADASEACDSSFFWLPMVKLGGKVNSCAIVGLAPAGRPYAYARLQNGRYYLLDMTVAGAQGLIDANC